MTSRLDTEAPSERARRRRFHTEFALGMGSYVVTLFIAVGAAQSLPDGPARWAIALLPAIPMVWVAVVSVRNLLGSDERERAILTRGLSVGFLVAMFTAITLGLLDAFGTPLPHAPWWIWTAGMLAWLVAGTVLRRR